ncbi:MAG: hypothetical protein ISS56_15115 [Anaerolineae bacterium]|nr:hypothetical protein [Anaerolineae bacterium]
MTIGLLVCIVALPLLVAAGITVIGRRAPLQLARRLTLGTSGLTVLLVLVLLPRAGSGLTAAVEWLPGTGAMALGLGSTGLYAVLVTSLSLCLALIGTTGGGGDRAVDGPRGSPLLEAVTLAALAAATAAFLAEHFLLRYVALEIAALCVALAPAIERRDPEPVHPPSGIALSRFVYLVLRLGDVGLLIAILILAEASGTLDITPALEAGQALDKTRLTPVVGGLLLAVSAKLGSWPFHLWSRVGRRLALRSHLWLYATVLPNLGIYLLYRVTPLLALSAPLQGAALVIGAGSAALAALLALIEADRRTGLVHLGAAQGGLVLFIAASGVKQAVWLTLPVMTALRLLLFLAVDGAETAGSQAGRRAMAGALTLGGLALVGFDLLTLQWAREAGIPQGALYVAEVGIGLICAWTARTAWQFASASGQPGKAAGTVTHWTRWAAIGVLCAGVLAAGLTFGRLAGWLSTAAHMTPPAVPTLPSTLLYAASRPALWAAVVLALAVWRFRSGLKRMALPAGRVHSAQVEIARRFRAAAQVNAGDRLILLIARAVVGGARLIHGIVEEGILGRSIHYATQTVTEGGRIAYRIVEREGLEGNLQRIVGGILSVSGWAQRMHTGRLRRNLLWMAIGLVATVLTLALFAW